MGATRVSRYVVTVGVALLMAGTVLTLPRAQGRGDASAGIARRLAQQEQQIDEGRRLGLISEREAYEMEAAGERVHAHMRETTDRHNGTLPLSSVILLNVQLDRIDAQIRARGVPPPALTVAPTAGGQQGR